MTAQMEISELLETMTLPDAVASVASFLVHLDADRVLQAVAGGGSLRPPGPAADAQNPGGG